MSGTDKPFLGHLDRMREHAAASEAIKKAGAEAHQEAINRKHDAEKRHQELIRREHEAKVEGGRADTNERFTKLPGMERVMLSVYRTQIIEDRLDALLDLLRANDPSPESPQNRIDFDQMSITAFYDISADQLDGRTARCVSLISDIEDLIRG